MMFHYLSSSMIILLLTISVSVVTSEAFTVTTRKTTTTQITNPSFLSTSSSITNSNTNTNNMLFARRGIHSSIHNIPYRGGAVKTASTSKTSTSTSLFTAASGNDGADKCPFSKTMAIFGSVWGTFGVIYILTKAIMRVAPIAYEPFMGTNSPLPGFSTIQWRYVIQVTKLQVILRNARK